MKEKAHGLMREDKKVEHSIAHWFSISLADKLEVGKSYTLLDLLQLHHGEKALKTRWKAMGIQGMESIANPRENTFSDS